MARTARVIAPGLPYHLMQRGNRRRRTIFGDDDYLTYITLPAEWCSRYDVEMWAYCLMPNHAHLIAVPASENGLRCAAAHLAGRDDVLVKAPPLLDVAGDWAAFLSTGCSDKEAEALRRRERTGMPLGSESFLSSLEAALGRPIRRQEPAKGPMSASGR
jgi:REP element-mobilizing transposase RayT